METVKIINMLQVSKYIKHGVKPIDMFYDNHTDKLIFVFDKKKTSKLFDLWVRRKLD